MDTYYIVKMYGGVHMQKLKSIFMILIINTLMMVGCTNDEDLEKNDMNSGNNTNTEVVNKLDELDEKEEDDIKETDQIENQNSTKDEEEDIETEKDEKDEINKEDDGINETKQVDIQLVTMDVHTSESIPLGNVSIDKNNDIEENLEIVIDKISELKFDDAPIELLKIENNIAYIDIRESDDKNYWSSNYFQGSTGASITSFTLVENILQRNYQGEWIDGIYFSYEGKTDIEFDHLDMDFFGNVISR